VFESNRFIVVRGNAIAIVLYFDGVESLILEAYICDRKSLEVCELKLLGHKPMLVADASRLFSTSSFTTEHKSTMT